MKHGFGIFAYTALAVVAMALLAGLLFLPDRNPIQATDEPTGVHAPVDASTQGGA
jgi:hypothetical protein